MSGDRTSDVEDAAAPPSSGPLTFCLRLTSDPRLLPVVRNTVAELTTVCGFKDEQRRRITLAVDEALSNIMRHAYKNRCDQEIEVSCHSESGCLEFSLIDRGEAVDRSRICVQPIDETAPGGRGTHLIRQIMDEVCYDQIPEGNRLRLKKYLPGIKTKQ